MKTRFLFCSLLTSSYLMILGTTGCVSVDESGGPSAPSVSNSAGYDRGFARGESDGVGGLSRTPDRYPGDFSEADRTDFFRGYEDGYNQGIRPGAGPSGSKKSKKEKKNQPAASYGQPLSSVNGQGTVTIMEGSRQVATCRTASPNVEQTRFITEQQQIVVKSRGNHGPATVQLFDTSSGAELGRVMAFDIKGGQPAWASGMGE